MLLEAIDLQQNAVAKLINKVYEKDEITFRAPTGSGKTHMMADFMNRIIAQESDVIFVVSTLSKGNLAEQNYGAFKKSADSNRFPNLKPYLVSSESANEERLFIPEAYNVYVLARDLYKKDSKLKDGGVLLDFLEQSTHNLFGNGQNKRIWLIKDECHQATKNLDELREEFFEKIINFSATPKISRKQHPDVEITDEEAEKAKLIKRVEFDSEENLDVEERGRNPEIAIRKFEEIREKYINLLGVNPCLIIQISNKDKAEEEWLNIERILNKTEHQHLKWMSIVEKKEKCKTNDKVGKLPVERWKDYAKGNSSTIDIIVFKMVISEGWDIPRACMLYQVRDTKSKQLDEQVMGRVRRNPRLTDFETLSPEAQNLAMTAWVWGIQPKELNAIRHVSLFGGVADIPNAIRLKTTRLIPPTERRDFDVEKFMENQTSLAAHTDVFTLFARLQKAENGLRNLCYDYANGDVLKWWLFSEHLDKISREYENYICDYEQSMQVVKNDDGSPREVSFPVSSQYLDNENYVNIDDWVWKRKDGQDKFSFDSEAEREWTSILQKISQNHAGLQETGKPNPQYGQMRTDGTPEPKHLNAENKKLWGKNYMTDSEIRYEYYLSGIHQSYPDFVMKDDRGQIHLFEVKSVNASNKANFDTIEYQEKIAALKLCYKYCSERTGHIFYLPVQKDDGWQITRFVNGEESTLSKDQFVKSFE